MTATGRDVLAAFDALPAPDQAAVAAEILRRTPTDGDLPAAAYDDLAAEVFAGYDTEEAAGATIG